ncbi:hypothetical protein FA15DRAFT_667361 [Coprinopsis marcescibilis]|uniref:Gelsolin-like domain-containing protein n=1 Tax=Coprinopsis marcescibilis TaxID=230819 RepID=A0A5C3L197_COPMA|nr:hypothetical protein FA15DRAFT_667361 [Coprinopsis marcescibilis]
MDQGRSYSRRSVDFPKPESDLAEWASKIKAMQRQVDADEEAEQRRLEAEITATRQARLRRSRQFSGRGLNVEGSPARNVDQWNLASPTTDASAVDRPRDEAERVGYQSEALRKIMGQNAVRVPESKPGEPVSLASFMGGRATGPRLNKHAPQQNAHDPTQFNYPDTSAPHPIFGRGGVAMPGMVSKQDLGGSNGRSIPPKPGYSASPSIQKIEETSKPNTLRTPTVAERRRSISPVAVGTEEFERYRPSSSPTPKSTLRSQKSSEHVGKQSGKEPDGYRYSAVGNTGLRSQKSSERLNKPTVGSEGFERYRPSSSPQPSLRTHKSHSNISYSTETPEKNRPPSRGTNAFNTPSKSNSRPASPEKRSVSPAKPAYRPHGFEPPQSATPDLKPQRFSVKDMSKPSTPMSLSGAGHSSSQENKNETSRPLSWLPHTASKPPAYSSPRDNAPLTRERTISTPSYLAKGAGSTASALSRPVQPAPRLPTGTPVLPAAAVVPSPAFRKPDISKEASPSISRLQGRGFVQNMVKVSLNLESQTTPSSTQSTPADKSRLGTSGKKSVLDRWPPNPQSPSPVSPTKPSTPTPVRRSATTDPSVTRLAEQRSNVSTPVSTVSNLQPNKTQTPASEPLTPRTATRFMDRMNPSSGNFGSATTMFVEKPATAISSVTTVDELGVKRDIQTSRYGRDVTSSNAKHHIASEIPAPTGKPLIHPTKGRAKRPKKNSATPENIREGIKETEVSIQHETHNPGRNSPLPRNVEIKPPLFRTPVAENKLDSKIGRLAEPWASGPIAPQPGVTHRTSVDSTLDPEPRSYAGIRHALPGLAKEVSSFGPRTPEFRDLYPAPRQPSAPARPNNERPSGERVTTPTSPTRHTRIPSSGNRATVMEVAQALHDHAKSDTSTAPQTDVEETQVEEPVVQPRPPVIPVQSNAEKRKSSYDRFSIATLPPLKEEATPAPSPANTLTRSVTAEFYPKQDASDSSSILVGQPLRLDPVEDPPRTTIPVRIENNDSFEPLPDVDVSVMFEPMISGSITPEGSKTISVDLLSITESSSTTLTKDRSVFYSTEVLAVVHRSKTQSAGLVDTFVWCWIGDQAQCGEREKKVFHDLARRYGTTPITVRRYSEPAHLVQLIGGTLAIRQGSRVRWSPENTAMHVVRSRGGVTLIEELDLTVKNLCSGFSFCVTLLGTAYVWHGVGSRDHEREAALSYAETLTQGGSVTELFEGQDDGDDSMFWMILGEDSFANADYWKWRKSTDLPDPAIWKIDSTKRVNTLAPVEVFSQETNPWQSVYVANCIWELFVLVGPGARSSRKDIRLALEVALKFAKRASSDRPFTPNVHVLIFPSQLPLDLRHHFRDLDESVLNRGSVPDHMNLISSREAYTQLQATTWLPSSLKDHTMLPLGVDAGIADSARVCN